MPDVAPATLYTGSSELGRIGNDVGYGMTGTGLTGAVTFDSQRRASQNMLDQFYDSDQRMILSDFDSPDPFWGSLYNLTGSSMPLHIEGLIAPGDSGRAVFMTDESGIRKLVGVNSLSPRASSMVCPIHLTAT